MGYDIVKAMKRLYVKTYGTLDSQKEVVVEENKPTLYYDDKGIPMLEKYLNDYLEYKLKNDTKRESHS